MGNALLYSPRKISRFMGCFSTIEKEGENAVGKFSLPLFFFGLSQADP